MRKQKIDILNKTIKKMNTKENIDLGIVLVGLSCVCSTLATGLASAVVGAYKGFLLSQGQEVNTPIEYLVGAQAANLGTLGYLCPEDQVKGLLVTDPTFKDKIYSGVGGTICGIHSAGMLFGAGVGLGYLAGSAKDWM